jgi:hypothetical protein
MRSPREIIEEMAQEIAALRSALQEIAKAEAPPSRNEVSRKSSAIRSMQKLAHSALQTPESGPRLDELSCDDYYDDGEGEEE